MSETRVARMFWDYEGQYATPPVDQHVELPDGTEGIFVAINEDGTVAGLEDWMTNPGLVVQHQDRVAAAISEILSREDTK